MASLWKISSREELAPWIKWLQITCFMYFFQLEAPLEQPSLQPRGPEVWLPDAWDWTSDMGGGMSYYFPVFRPSS